jgi:hypothetical protein
MKRSSVLVCLFALLWCVAPVLAVEKLVEPVYSVRLEARYDPEKGHISGVEHLTWKNMTSAPTSELQFHLYLNAFANNQTTFMRESGGQLRGAMIPEDRWGWIEVKSATLATGEDLKKGEQFIHPDDDNAEDRSVARYPLPKPLQPGESVAVEIVFEARLSGVFARNGAAGDFALGGQWFPKIGVLEDIGMRGRTDVGWNCHQYHANSEFYADFGDYDVTLTLPVRYRGKIGATGQLVSEEVEGDNVRARFVQHGVHDFAWTADPRYVVIEERFDPEKDVPADQRAKIAALLGVAPAELALTPVDIRLMLSPANRAFARRYLDSAKAAIRGFGLRLGAYPWATLTLVDPPRGAFGAAGMEYPTFITLGAHPALALPPLREVLASEDVTIHEFGHNFFQGLIASNEFEESWIDEGMTSYYEMVVMEEEYASVARLLGHNIPPFDSNMSRLGEGRYSDPIVRASWQFAPGGSYGLSSYARPAVTLRHLEKLLGPEVFHRAMWRFFQTWRFRHPSTADFEKIMQESTDKDLSWFLSQALHSTATLDYRVRSATSKRVRDPEGHYWEAGERKPTGKDEKVKTKDEKTKEVGKDTKKDKDALYESVVVVDRAGEFVHPVEIEMVFEDGSKERRSWDGREVWTCWRVTRPSRLARADVDPDNLLALDVNRLNNSYRLVAKGAPASSLAAWLLFFVQNTLALVGFVG